MTPSRVDAGARVYELAYIGAHLTAWSLTWATMWRFFVGDFQHPIYVLVRLIDHHICMRLPAGSYWMAPPPTWGDGVGALVLLSAYYVTGLLFYAGAGCMIISVFKRLDWLMTSNGRRG